jgi:hypothetical protein
MREGNFYGEAEAQPGCGKFRQTVCSEHESSFEAGVIEYELSFS